MTAGDFDARVEQRVFGKVPCEHWKNVNFGSGGGPHAIPTEDCTHVIDGVRGAGCYPCGEALWFGARDFTRPENDYMVLKKVREEWGRDLQHGFICWLASRWDNRAGLSFIAYLPGDYARAALAAMEAEDG